MQQYILLPTEGYWLTAVPTFGTLAFLFNPYAPLSFCSLDTLLPEGF